MNNWSNSYSITLQNCATNQTMTFNNINTQNDGTGVLDTSSGTITNGEYSMTVQGYSHLRKKFECTTINTIEANMDLTTNHKVLLAGEISPIFDNYINSLDLSVLVDNFRTDNLKSDLNRDGKVNSLDLSNLVDNLFLAGD